MSEGGISLAYAAGSEEFCPPHLSRPALDDESAIRTTCLDTVVVFNLCYSLDGKDPVLVKPIHNIRFYEMEKDLMHLPSWFQGAAVAAMVGVSLFTHRPILAEDQPPRKTKRAWTLQEARAELLLNPRDPYLQYVVLQLARRRNKLEEVAKSIAELLGGDPSERRGRTGRADLFSIFTGALAVQESLQLDTMGSSTDGRAAFQPPLRTISREVPDTVVEKVYYTVAKQVPVEIDKDGVKTTVKKTVYETRYKEVTRTVFRNVSIRVPSWPMVYTSAAVTMASPCGPLLAATTLADLSRDKRRPGVVDVAALSGPTIKSHPWRKMLAGRKPDISPLARCVPDDFYFAEFRSVNRLLEALEISDLWSTHLYNQAAREARSQRVGERLKEQLAVHNNEVLRSFSDRVVEAVAVTGSDLYLREGSDVTLIFQLKQPRPFKARMDALLKEAAKSHPNSRTSTGEYLGVPYVHVGTPERGLHVFSAYPRADLHVRSNSLTALRRIIEAIQGRDAKGNKVRRLGDTLEFAYLRTLLPRGAKEEDGLIYLSDPFIRHQVGPRLKLTERRRLLCYNHLRMIGHASMLYRTEFGQAPRSLAELIEARCLPDNFGKGPFVCPDGGRYSLSADGNLGICSHHGHAHFLRPCCENALARVTADEADDYDDFVADYNRYWRTYFDPIAIRIQVSPRRYRLETIVLPLIDNSIYTGLAAVLGGKPEPLDALPVPKGNIFSVNFRFNKDAVYKELQGLFADGIKSPSLIGLYSSDPSAEVLALLGAAPTTALPGAVPWAPLAIIGRDPLEDLLENDALARELKKLGVPDKEARKLTYKNVRKVLFQGLGNQIGFHVYDAEPHVDFNMPRFFGDAIRMLNDQGDDEALIAFGLFLLSSANSPAYFSLPIQDVALVDDFLDALDAVSAGLARVRYPLGIKTDFYRIVHPSKVVIRGNGIQFGPVTWRFFTARIGKTFYVATKRYILEDLIAAEAAGTRKKDPGPVAHAMVRVRPENWNKTLADYRLGWSENNRQACLCNLGPLSQVGRAFGTSLGRGEYSEAQAARRGRDICRLADRLYAAHFFCPDGGHYLLDRDGRAMTCSVHGWNQQPRQFAIPRDRADDNKLLRGFGGMTITLTFLEDGLRAVLTIDRKP